MTQPLLKTPLAIVGMACRLPGAGNLSEFWELLRGGRDAITEMPPERLDRSLYYHPEKGQRGKTYSTLGGFIPDRPLFRLEKVLDAREIANADACHRILCDVALEACEHARWNIHEFRHTNTGVYVGHSAGSNLGGELAFATHAEETLDYLRDVPDFAALGTAAAEAVICRTVERLRRSRPKRAPDGGPDVEANFAAALIAKALRLDGPHFVVDAACASSLVALVAAALALEEGAIDAAIVGGASYNKGDSLILFSQAHSCSARASCPFDSQADGLISSEGYVALIVKLLPRAIADGDSIQAVISGMGLSSDGRGKSLWAPRKEGQVEAVRRAYGAGADPRDVQFIEAHATSTQVGDATEIDALATFFQPYHNESKAKIPIGSVKSNIGHTLETAGLAGLIKTVLAIQHAEIPPTVRLRQPHPEIPWQSLPFRVPTQTEAWPRLAPGQKRCAAVNAFGIGGLNVHLVVEQYATPANLAADTSGSSVPAPTTKSKSQPIAIIGRGVILPGASSVREFESLLRSGKCAITEPPSPRWRKKIGLLPGALQHWHTPLAIGGFIADYAYDWKSNKVPPKQVAQANPLQFMLLDAAQQALSEAGYDQKALDRSTAAVVVGNVFGGEFANHLQVGLRLPEIKRELSDELRVAGVPAAQVEHIIQRFAETLLAAKPALLDETGSFTSSTLASRVSKTLNLMGGAMAIDAGDCSSFAALSMACHLLRSGANSLVLCAAAQRSMDLAAYESLAFHRRLLNCADQANDGFVPGEGVVLLLLKRLDDAQRDNDPIFGVIDGVGAAMNSGNLSSATELASRRAIASVSESTERPTHVLFGCGLERNDRAEQDGLQATYRRDFKQSTNGLVKRVGHLHAAQGLASIVQATLNTPHEIAGISVNTPSGLAYHVLIKPEGMVKINSETRQSSTAISSETDSQSDVRVFHLSAVSPTLLVRKVEQLLSGVERLWTEVGTPAAVAEGVRLSIVANSPGDLASKLSLVTKAGPDFDAASDLLREQGIFYSAAARRQRRIAFAFPGQGSQYPGMLQEMVSCSALAAAALAEADRAMAELRFPKFAELAWRETNRLGSDIWATQMSMLVADVLGLAAARELGLEAECLLGHSFGEFAALVAAGSLTLTQAIRLTDQRSRAVEQAVAPGFGMLSIKTALADIQPYLAEYEGRLFVSHHNSPEQVVVGGFSESLGELESRLSWNKIAARHLPVPTAYHTPFMQPMVEAWSSAVAKERFLPPRSLLLSSVTNKYVADPNDIRDNLVAQMLTPVRYVELLHKLVQDGVDTIIEVGPQQLLTQLHRRTITNSDIILTSIDHPKRSAREQFARVIAELECGGWSRSRATENSMIRVSSASKCSPARCLEPIEAFDATVRRKDRRRKESTNVAQLPRAAEPVAVFDATAPRRSRVRSNGASAPVGQELSQSTIAATSAAPTSIVVTAGGSPNIQEPKSEPTHSRGEIDQILTDFVVEHTGYPANLINFDWDMEADLGIDSIKRAQLFGELRDHFQLQPQSGGSLDDYRTLRQIADLLHTRLAARAKPSELDRIEQPLDSRPQAVPSYDTSPIVDLPADDTPLVQTLDRNKLQQAVIDFVVDQTGYPPDVVDLDADFEADLGIDSIKMAQLLGELRDQYSLSLPEGVRSDLAKYRSVRQIVELLVHSSGIVEHVPTFTGDGDRDDRHRGNGHGGEGHGGQGNPAGGRDDDDLSFGRVSNEVERPTIPFDTFRASPAIAEVLPINAFRQTAARQVADAPTRPGLAFSQSSPRYLTGVEHGRRHAQTIRRLLRNAADVHLSNGHAMVLQPRQILSHRDFSADELSELQGIADGAGVFLENVLAFQNSPVLDEKHDALLRFGFASTASKDLAEEFAIAHRYRLHMVRSVQRTVNTLTPTWSGAAVIFGRNALSEEIRRRILAEGHNAYIVAPTEDPAVCVAELEKIWQQEPVPHLFITSPRDSGAQTSWDSRDFQQRRRLGVMAPFWFCQRWAKLTIAAGLMDSASLVGLLALGGDFGFQQQPSAVESGAITGLFKSILVENWMNGYRTTPVKLLDSPTQLPISELVDAIWHELTVASYDCEIAWHDRKRSVVRVQREPIGARGPTAIQAGGAWVCTGGARGITAYVAEHLAARYAIKLHLIGLSPAPSGPNISRTFSDTELRELKIEVMQKARESGKSPVKEWERVEKSFEIHHTLDKLADLGVAASYHACDVADPVAMKLVLDQIREQDGPIRGIIHGAGVGKDARFERKEPDRVEQCIRAKVDGARTLMELTRHDPLTHFVAFGSISGRFGANGHTDYSLANDMLCKLVDWYHHERPDVHSVAFHWHAWGDVGMAMKPETKLALEMVGMQFMPATEGIAHLINEMESTACESEVLITDDKYYRMYYPMETSESAGKTKSMRTSLFEDAQPEIVDGQWTIGVQLDPIRDPFLIEHRLDDRPLFPFVIALEMLAEAAIRFQGSGSACVARLMNVEAFHPLRFFTDRPQMVRVQVEAKSSTVMHCRLVADFCSRDGRLIEANRVYFTGDVEVCQAREFPAYTIATSADGQWHQVEYAPRGAKFHLGPPLRRLKKLRMDEGRAVGKILAPALIELAGFHRLVEHWLIPSAAIDACLYATGMLCWSQVAPGATLPVRFGSIELGRMPDPGEACQVEVRFIRRDGRSAVFDFTLCGDDGAILVLVRDYRISWIGGDPGKPTIADVRTEGVANP